MEKVPSDWFFARALVRQIRDLVLVMEALIILEPAAFGQVLLTGRVIDESNAAVAGVCRQNCVRQQIQVINAGAVAAPYVINPGP